MTMLHRAFAVLFCLSLPVFAQQSPDVKESGAPQVEAAASQPQESADHRLALDVVVTDKAGRPVSGLQQQDFTFFDNKKPQTVLSFAAVQEDAATVDPPAHVLLLIDEVNTSYQSVAYEREQIKKFLLQNGGKLAQPVSLVFFSDQGTQVQGQGSRDGNALMTGFDQHDSGLRSIRRSQGYYGAVERYQLSLNTLEKIAQHEAANPGRKLLIWVSPGWPMLSGPEVDLDRKQMQSLFNSIVGLSRGLREARITLYAIDPLGMSDAGGLRQNYYEAFLKGVTSANQVQSGDLALEVLAVQSGGLVLKSSNDIASEVARSAADATAYYTLSVDTPPAEHANEYHAIQVKVNKPGLTARTRTGYYAQP